MKIDTYFSCCRKHIFKWIKDLNIKPVTSYNRGEIGKDQQILWHRVKFPK